MNIAAKLMSLAGASCLIAFATPAPALADTKPCCYNSGRYANSSPSTCRKYGGYVVEQHYCQRYYGPGGYNDYDDDDYDRRGDYYGSRPNAAFSIILGNVVIAYSDGYYDRHRRWHRWRSDSERAWFRQHRRHAYHHMHHDHDRDRNRRDWRDGRRRDRN